MILLKAPILKKSHLLGLAFEVFWLGMTKFSKPNLSRQPMPVGRGLFNGHLYDSIADTALAEIETNADRSFALIDSGLNERLCESVITLQILIRKRLNLLFDQASQVPLVGQLPY